MCGIVGFLDKRGRADFPTGQAILTMLRALACRGPDSAGTAVLREPKADDVWRLRLAGDPSVAARLIGSQVEGDTVTLDLEHADDATAASVETWFGGRPGGLEMLCLGTRLDLVKQVGSPDALELAYHVSGWRGPLGIGHTRLSTESKIDLSHSQPFWAHGVPDLATAHNGHVTNYHKLRRHYETQGMTFYTDNDSEVIGVYVRDRLERGRTLPEALADALTDLDGAYNVVVASSAGLGILRDRHGFKPLFLAETDDFVAVATEEIALRRALPGSYRVFEPPTGVALFFPLVEALAHVG